ncbi:Uma2 family endonuclease [Bradyrhizobium tropiciagri]|uniref:Uma2 family endonuclease n=1 Tax=Bradyrhizobium tropiciagri TaxID=312253 RepID=UPI00067C868E|nr:Uma2 family endonuclease [Bradyrhizobium tropiciagri]
MDVPEHEKLTIKDFFDAIAGVEGRYELVGGVAYAMTGAKEAHNIICSNVQTVLVPAGKQKGWRTTSSNTAVQTGPTTIRYPDVVVDCGPPNAAAMTASKPTIIVEVSSPDTAVFEHCSKLREYQDVESVDTVMQIESGIALVKIHRRQEDVTWTEETFEEFEVAIPLPSLGTSITLNEIYDTLEVRPRARLKVFRIDHSHRF